MGDLSIVDKDIPKIGSAQEAEKVGRRLQEADQSLKLSENRRKEAEVLSQRRLQELLKVEQEKRALEEKLVQIKKLVEKNEDVGGCS